MAQTALAVRAESDRWSMPSPLLAISDEHRYVTRMLVLMEEEIEHLNAGEEPDFACMESILNYIIHYPDRYHHPKEELIFDRMEARADKKTLATIRRLRMGHGQVTDMGQALYHEVLAVKASRSKTRRKALASHAKKYVTGLRDHIALEENEIFEPAITLLTEADWRAVDRAIKPIIDPVFGEKKDHKYKDLFQRYLDRVVTVSTGAVPASLIESAASSGEKLFYTTRELSRLPKRLFRQSRSAAKAQREALGALASARDMDSAGEAIKSFSSQYVNFGRNSLSLIRSALKAHEVDDLDDTEEGREPVHLREGEEFAHYHDEPPVFDSNGRISWQATVTNLLFRSTVKQLLANIGTDYAEQTKKMTFLFDRLPENTMVEQVDFPSFHARWVKPKGQHATQRTLLYLPGGGFFFPATFGHTNIVAELTRQTKSRGFMVHYRLAPDHPFPAGLEDAIHAYKYLLEQGIRPEDIVLAGDSAGGGLSLSLLLALRDDGIPLPRAAVLLSPLTDLSFSTASRQFNRFKDPMLPTARKMRGFELYTGDTPVDFPLLSPIYGDLSALPPIFAQVGSTEILLDDTLSVARKAREQGVDVEVEVWEKLPHVWHLFSYLPESRRALKHVAAFINEQLSRENTSRLESRA